MRDARQIVGLIAAALAALCGCASREDVRSLTYDYTDQTRKAAEMWADQDIHDACYFSGAQYPSLEGPPQIVAEDGPTGRRYRATQAFVCIGTRGEGP